MQVLALISRKGGTGKSTLAIGLAGAALESGHNVCVVEADPLGTVSNWRRRRDRAAPSVETVHDGLALLARLPTLAARGVTLAIIDTAGGWSETFNTAVYVADLCLITARPSLADIEAAGPALTAVRAVKKPFAFVLNQAPIRSYRVGNAASALCDAAAAFELRDVIALPAIAARSDHQDGLGLGLTVTELAGDGKSAAEIRGLWQWVTARLDSLSAQHVETVVPAIAAPAMMQDDVRSDLTMRTAPGQDHAIFGSATAANQETALHAAG
ncbi:MAG TPA: ParA family protein [Xanthobacteraceae bacterium]